MTDEKKFGLQIVDEKFKQKQPEKVDIKLKKDELVMLFDMESFLSGVENTLEGSEKSEEPKFIPVYLKLFNKDAPQIECKHVDEETNIGTIEFKPFQVQMCIQILYNCGNAFLLAAVENDSKKEDARLSKIGRDTGDLGRVIEEQAKLQGWFPADYPELDLKLY